MMDVSLPIGMYSSDLSAAFSRARLIRAGGVMVHTFQVYLETGSRFDACAAHYF